MSRNTTTPTCHEMFNLLFWSSNAFEAEMLNWYSSQYKLTKFWLLILVRKIYILLKKIVPRVFHQTPRFPQPGTPYPVPRTPYPGTPTPRFPPSLWTWPETSSEGPNKILCCTRSNLHWFVLAKKPAVTLWPCFTRVRDVYEPFYLTLALLRRVF